MKGGFTMSTKTYIIPELIIDAKEELALTTLTETYNEAVCEDIQLQRKHY